MTFADYFGESEEVKFDDCFSRSFKGFGQAGEERRVGEGRGEGCGETQNFEQSINQTVVSQVRLGQDDLKGGGMDARIEDPLKRHPRCLDKASDKRIRSKLL